MVLEAEAANIVKLVEEGERKAEIERQEQEARHQEWLREKEIQRRERALQESRKELFEIIDVWAEVNKIVGFFSDAELKAAHLSDEEKAVMLERLDRARKIVGENDALELFRLWKAPEER